MNWLPILFALNFSLLLLHEMDAIHAKEWRMFVILKSMREDAAYIVFALVHLPLYFWIIFSISQVPSSTYAFVWLITDIFLIAHSIIHFFFRRHKANGFTSLYSNALIYIMGIIALIHLIMLF